MWEPIQRTMAVVCLLGVSTAGPAAAGGPDGPLTRERALALAMERSPELGALLHEEGAEEGRLVQAGRRPNPEFGIEAENFGGSGALGGFDARETTLLLRQTVELGGKRDRRVRAAAIRRELAALARREGVLLLGREVQERFADLVAAEEEARLAGDRVHLAEDLIEVVRRRREAGAGSPADEVNARVALEEGRVARLRAEAGRDRAARALAALWGATEFTFSGAVPSPHEPPLPDRGRVAALAAAGVVAERAALERGLADAETDAARAEGVPDLEIGGGIRSFSDEGEWAWVAEAAIPLPLFDRGRGRSDEAAARAAAAKERERAVRIEATAEALDALDRLAGLRAERAALQGLVIPEAERALEATRRAFEIGRLPMAEVLEARRALLDPMARVIELRAEAGHALAKLEFILGTALAEIPAGEEQR